MRKRLLPPHVRNLCVGLIRGFDLYVADGELLDGIVLRHITMRKTLPEEMLAKLSTRDFRGAVMFAVSREVDPVDGTLGEGLLVNGVPASWHLERILRKWGYLDYTRDGAAPLYFNLFNKI